MFSCPGDRQQMFPAKSKKKTGSGDLESKESGQTPSVPNTKLARLQEAKESLERLPPECTQCCFYIDGSRKRKSVLNPRVVHLASHLSESSVLLVKKGSTVRQLTQAEMCRAHGCALDFSLCAPSYTGSTIASMASVPIVLTMLLFGCQICCIIEART